LARCATFASADGVRIGCAYATDATATYLIDDVAVH